MHAPATLAICIPTHHGRAETIGDAIESVVAQLGPAHAGRVSMVVSDNASADGTEELVLGLRERLGVPLTYRRNERNLGVAGNVDAVIEHADAEWCWLLSSDDILLPGAVDRVLALLAAHPGADAISVNQVVFDRDLRGPTLEQPTLIAGRSHEVSEIHGLNEIVGELGWIMSGLSSQLVRRSAWRRVVAELRTSDGWGELLFPHVAAMLAVAARNPVFVWCPEKLAVVRADNVDAGLEGTRAEARKLAELDRHWRAAVGRRGSGRRRITRRYLEAFLVRDTFGALRRMGARRSDRLALAWAFAGAAGRLWRFWTAALPDLLRPHPRRPADPAPDAPGQPPMAALELGACRTVVRAGVRERMGPADVDHVVCRVENRGPVALASAAPHPVHVASHWTLEGGPRHEGLRVRLPRPLRPGRAMAVTLPVQAPWEPGRWRLTIDVVQEGVAWFGDAGAGAEPFVAAVDVVP